MATTTTNFGWDIPQSTDLVKDGATAIATLGQDIDTALVDLKGGTTGQVLSKNSGTDLDFTWATPGGAKILQVVTATSSTATTIATTSFTDTSLTASITPSASTSKILVLVNQFMYVSRSSSFMGAGLSLLRGSTEIYTNSSLLNAGLLATGNGSVTEIYHYANLNYVDSPASTSSLTYKTQAAVYTTANGGTSTWQKDSVPSSIILMEIGA